MRKLWVTLLLLLVLSSAFATPVNVLPNLPAMQQVGSVLFKYWFWKVYDIQLYAVKKPWSYEQSFALKIDYLRSFAGQDIVKETIAQIRRQPQQYKDKTLQQWRQAMLAIFPNVEPGSVLIGYFDGDQTSTFYNGKGKLLGRIQGRDFAKAFFNIWLGQHSMDPKLTKRLLGQDND